MKGNIRVKIIKVTRKKENCDMGKVELLKGNEMKCCE